MAQILAYPLARRRGLIRKQGARLAGMPKQEAEKHLAYLLRLQGETLAKKGIEAAEVERQVSTLETAIRCEIARHLVTCGGAA